MKVCFSPDDSLLPGQTRIDRLRTMTPQDLPLPISQTQARMDASVAQTAIIPEADDEDEVEDEADDIAAPEAGATPAKAASGAEETSEEAQRRRRKRRRRRGGRRDDVAPAPGAPMPPDAEQPDLDGLRFPTAMSADAPVQAAFDAPPVLPGLPAQSADRPEAEAGSEAAPVPGHDEAAEAGEEQAKPKPRSRRGSRRRTRPDGEGDTAPSAQTYSPPAYSGPTPADPFGNVADIFDILERAAEQRDTAPVPSWASPRELTATAITPPANAGRDDQMAAVGTAPQQQATPSDTAAQPQAPEPVVGPAIKPVVIGQDEAPAERKRGWWRR
jgi:ribonuclease E